MGYFQISQPVYHKNTNIFKNSNINTKVLSSNIIFYLKTKINLKNVMTGRIYKIKFRTYKNMCRPNSLQVKQDS